MFELLSTLPEKHREIWIVRLVVGRSAEATAVGVAPWVVPRELSAWLDTSLRETEKEVTRAGERFG